MKKFLNFFRPSTTTAPVADEDPWSKIPTPTNTYSPPSFAHPPPPKNRPLPLLPAELHLQILTHTSWEDHPTLSRVCKLWRHFLKTSPEILSSHYENYNPFYEEAFASSILKDRPRPYLHKVVEHLSTLIRHPKTGNFQPGRIQLKEPRDRWGGHWDFSKSTSFSAGARYIFPQCRFLPPIDYSFFKDEPVVRYTPGRGEKVGIKVTDTSYSSEYIHTTISTKPLNFYEDMTVEEYITELVRLVNLEESLCEYSYDPDRVIPEIEEGNWSNVVWVSVYSTMMITVSVRWVVKGVYYRVAKDSYLYST
ncbi:hypothetical protein TWF481_006611 [Arthrobotrys musiformis]|uniref:F-box domain-containing protein n=1 Tax=Arthrobotrys musiformis TaxID=47236 RepID=A0AAV9W956_9PEZI